MDKDYFPDINRAAIIIRLKKPFIDWLVYTSKEYDDPEHKLKQEEVQTEGFDSKQIYLIPAFDENPEYDEFLKKNYKEIFEHELSGWYTEPKMWPKDRTWKVFKEWFDFEIHSMVYDTTPKNPIEYEG